MKFLLSFLVTLFLCQPVLHAADSSSGKTTSPNFIVLLADDMGWGDAGCYGNPLIKTPNLDKLASQGVKFTQCYAASGVCSPSRSAILTGRTPYRNGVWRHLSGAHEAHLRASEITYPKLLQQQGFSTCHVGKWHLNAQPQFNNPEYPQPHDHGYDYWFTTHNNASPSHKNPVNFYRNGKAVGEITGYSAQIVAQEAISWLKEKRPPEKPFLLSVWFHEPHLPIASDPRFLELYPSHQNKTYMANISQLDHAVGMIMDALDALGETENTFLLFTSDNGPEGKDQARGGSTAGLRGRKRDDHEGGIRVPGLVRYPKLIKPGTVNTTPIIGSDIFPTALELAGVPLPSDRTLDGVSLLPLFQGHPLSRPVPLFWRTHVSPAESRVALREGDWKIVGNETLEIVQLYHIQEDQSEEHDLSSKMPEKTAEMKALLKQTWKEIEEEGPSHWWKKESARGNHKKNGSVLSY